MFDRFNRVLGYWVTGNSTKSEKNDNPLHSASRSFDGNSDGETPLHLAVQNRGCSEKQIELLLTYGADVQASTPRDGNTVLHLFVASCRDDVPEVQKIVDLLVDKGSEVIAKSIEGPHDLAARTELVIEGSTLTPDLTQKILRHSIVQAKNHKGDTPLHLAVRNHADQISILLVIALLNRGADVDERNALGENAYQAYCSAVDKVNRKADPTLLAILGANERTHSSLHAACVYHNVDSVRRLLSLDADVNASDKLGYSPLFYAFTSNFYGTCRDDRLTTLKLLLDFGAINFGFQDTKGWWKDPCTEKLFIEHLAKLSALQKRQTGICIGQNPFEDRKHRSVYDDCLPRCSQELNAMSVSKIGESGVTFLNLLLLSELANTRNKELVKAFHAGKVKFPLYQGMLDAKIAKPLMRQKLIEEAAEVLSNALRFADPSDEFYVRTLSYCSNRDLMNVIDATKVVKSRDLVGGIYQCLDKLRKTAFASLCLFGTEQPPADL
ncbi:hypothetical protein TSAR_008679 [Trichomalopsis sarcophagae]|uniref:Uncharacterized protein n=1 Tax=Trichomalopsis sarcophagae TaxID=543379 RepID=A0A232ETY9_9HYME|nr:hypothetical protein TSAR_008679 [Trichomalopsis sarcophagae]